MPRKKSTSKKPKKSKTKKGRKKYTDEEIEEIEQDLLAFENEIFVILSKRDFFPKEFSSISGLDSFKK